MEKFAQFMESVSAFTVSTTDSNCYLSSASFIQSMRPYCYGNMIFNIILLSTSGFFSGGFLPFCKARRNALQKWFPEAGNTAIYVNDVYVECVRKLAMICVHVTFLVWVCVRVGV